MAVLLGVLSSLAVPARALERHEREAGSYSVDVFSAAEDEARLPRELRASDAPGRPASDARAQDAVELRWTAREGTGLRGYRLTARIDDGPLSGLATEWQIAPGSGRRHDGNGAYAYLVRLELPAFFPAHVRATLEGVLTDGSRILLAVREARIRPLPQARQRVTSASRQADERVRPSAAAAERAWPALGHESTTLSTRPTPSPVTATVAPRRASGGDTTRGRGPPRSPLSDTLAV